MNFTLRYPGQVFDEETGLSYNLHRYYDAATGRYIQADPIGLAGGWNRFGYVGGDPLNAIDPDGLNAVVALNRIAELGRGLYYRYGPAITEFIAGASGVNGAVASPAAINPLVAQIPTGVSRILPIVRGISEGVESGAFACISNLPTIKNGELIERTFMTSRGPVDFMAEAVISNNHLLLRDAVLYPRGAEPLTGMSKDIYRGFGSMKDWASNQGFTSLEISGTRAANSTSATPGSFWTKYWDLRK